MKKLFVFDVDGTLLDTKPIFRKVVDQYFTERGRPPPPDEIIYKEFGGFEHYKNPIWDFGDGKQKEHAYAIYGLVDDHLHQADTMAQLFPYSKEVLAKLQDADIMMAICTSKPWAPLDSTFKHYDIWRYFEGHRTQDDVKNRGHRNKPYPDKLLCLMDELDFSPAQTTMLGDTTYDMHMAKAAGVEAIGVTWGFHGADDLKSAGAKHVLNNDWRQLFELI